MRPLEDVLAKLPEVAPIGLELAATRGSAEALTARLAAACRAHARTSTGAVRLLLNATPSISWAPHEVATALGFDSRRTNATAMLKRLVAAGGAHKVGAGRYAGFGQ